jgi:ATP-binding cassette, subfamily C, bacterial
MIDKKQKSTWLMVASLMRDYPWQTATSTILLLLVGLTDVVGIAALVPLFAVVTRSSSGTDSPFTNYVDQSFNYFQIDPTLVSALSIFVLAIVAKSIFNIFAMAQVAQAATRVGADWRLKLVNKHLNANWSHLTTLPAGRLATAVGKEAERISANYNSWAAMLAAGIRAIIHMAVALSISWYVTAASMGVGFLTIILLGSLLSRTRIAGTKLTKSLADFTTMLVDSLGGMKAVKAMGKEASIGRLMEKEIWNLRRFERSQSILGQTVKSLQEPIMIAALAIGLFFFIEIMQYKIEIVMVLVLLYARTVQSINGLQKAYQNIAAREASYWFVRELTDSASAAQEEFSGSKKPEFNNEIKLKNVSFSYGEGKVLDNISLEIPFGKMVSLKGTSGAGKTTLTDLIIGLIAPSAGEIEIDGINISNLHKLAWRKEIGFVPQEMYLFHGSVFTNVSLEDKSVTREMVEQALKAAQIWDDIVDLPEGMDTIVGERGSRFSGGQRQRIAIARALVRNPKLLILDEATTALDPTTENAICDTLKSLSGKVTILAVSHQEALHNCSDRIYCLSRGILKAESAKGNQITEKTAV